MRILGSQIAVYATKYGSETIKLVDVMLTCRNLLEGQVKATFESCMLFISDETAFSSKLENGLFLFESAPIMIVTKAPT